MNPVLIGLGLLVLAGQASRRAAPEPSPVSTLDPSTLLAPGYPLAAFLVSGSRPDLAAELRPTDDEVANLTRVAALLARFEALTGIHLRVTSGDRDEDLNEAIGGEEDSQHLRGEAVDVVAPGRTSFELADLWLDAGLPFDQLLAYTPRDGGHLHVSYTVRRSNRSDFAVVDGGRLHRSGSPRATLDAWS